MNALHLDSLVFAYSRLAFLVRSGEIATIWDLHSFARILRRLAWPVSWYDLMLGGLLAGFCH